MNLVDRKDLIGNSNILNSFGGDKISEMIMHVLKLNELNNLYDQTYDCKGLDFVDSILNKLGVSFKFDKKQLEQIPAKGPFICVSNHPFGGIDGLILIKLICSVRPDFKVMANYLLSNIEPMENYFIGVNPFDDIGSKTLSISGVKNTLKYLENGNCIGVFPSGEVSSYKIKSKSVCDKQWGRSIVKLIKKSKVPVVPIYFDGSNSKLFHLLGFIHPRLRTIKLPSEIFNKKNIIVDVSVGKQISVKEQYEIIDIEKYGRYLRAKIYVLKNSNNKLLCCDANKSSSYKENAPSEVVAEIDKNIICNEIGSLDDCLLFCRGIYSVYCANAIRIPNILNEIARLREITFRDVGEGTNNKSDLDKYDKYYNQLFIWNNKNSKLVGAYRIGKGRDIINEYGVEGFYINSLFKIKKSFIPKLERSLELGRSFIVKEYQKKPMPLFLLWKAILYYLSVNKDYKYLIGPVTISNRYSDLSKCLLIEFINRNFTNPKLSKCISPRNKFNLNIKNIDLDIFLETANKDINKIDKYIDYIEGGNLKIPILLKKYISLNAKVIGFNVDALFNNCIDGFLMLDIEDVPLDILTSLSKEFKDNDLLRRITEKNIDN